MRKNLNIQKLKVAVFDWDNTLAQSRPALVYAVNRVLREYSLPDWEVVKHKRDNNLSFKDNFPRIFGDNAVAAYQKYCQIYLQNVGNLIQSFPYTTETLQFFTQHKIPVMIMTNKDRRLLEFELPLLFNPEIFAGIACGHEADADKPHGAHLQYTVKNILSPDQITPDCVWVIGDSPQDSSCARQAGARAIRIGKSVWNDENREIYNDIDFFESFADFYAALTSCL